MKADNEYHRLIQAMVIFQKYEHTPGIAARHDELFAGPDPDDVSDEDRARLEALGWRDSGECWLPRWRSDAS